MKNDRLLNAFGQIDERYIAEAAPGTDYLETREKEMNTNKTRTIFRRPVAMAAVLALCVCLLGATALAATGTLRGFFEDVFGWDGAVAGTSYEQATEELGLNAAAAADQLVVEVTMLYPDKVPYSELETLGIQSYTIVDGDDRVVAEGAAAPAAVTDGKTAVSISLDGLADGAYTLIVSELTGGKKADQPLALRGSWECDFTK